MSKFRPESNATQFEKYKPGKICDVVLGLDFGTSSTRVVLRTPYHFNSRTFAVNWGELGHESNRFLLPSRVHLSEAETLSLSSSKATTRIDNLKMLFLDDPRGYVIDEDGSELAVVVEEVAAGYLALVLRHGRRWFLHHQAGAYGNLELRWWLNLGIPSAGYDDDEIRENHERLARAAWGLSVSDEPITLETACRAVQDMGSTREFGIPKDRVHVIPEVAAEVVGYAKSNLRRRDLHVLVDIGASTLDICGFVLHDRDGDDRYELLTAEVEKLGVLRLHLHRIEKVQKCMQRWVRHELLPSDPIQAFLRECEEYCPAEEKLAEMDVDYLDSDFHNECVQVVMRTLMGLKKARYSTYDYPNKRVPIFMCGGGSRATFFSDVLDLADKRFRKAGLKGLDFEKLPLPDLANRDVDEEAFQFLGVGYGLSYPPYDIGKIRRPSEIPSIERPTPVDWRRFYIDKDQV